MWSLDWPGDPGGLAPKLGTRIERKSESAKEVGGGAISQYNAEKADASNSGNRQH